MTGDNKSDSDSDDSSSMGGFSDDSSQDRTEMVQRRPQKAKATPIRKPSRKKNTRQKKIMEAERKKQARLRQQRLREQSMNDPEDEEEDDSDDELLADSMPKKEKTKSIDLLSSSDSSLEVLSPPKAASAIDIDSDDSDSDSDDDIDPSTIQVRLDEKTAQMLAKSRLARSNLHTAQDYHADDVHVEVEEPEFLLTPTVVRRAPRPPPKIDYGKPLRVNCGCRSLGGQNLPKEKQSVFLTVKEKEPLSHLIERFCKAHNLAPEKSTIALNFDGQTLDPTKTPIFYELEDEDLIHVTSSVQS